LTNPTDEFVTCLAGLLKVGLSAETYLLEASDSIHFQGSDLTSFGNGSETEETVWLSVVTPAAYQREALSSTDAVRLSDFGEPMSTVMFAKRRIGGRHQTGLDPLTCSSG
jgi:hypothetical protein